MGVTDQNFSSAKMKFLTFVAYFAAIGDDCTNDPCRDSEYCYESTAFDYTTTKICTACPVGVGIITTEALCGEDQVCKDTCSSAATTAFSFLIALVLAAFYKF